MLWCLDHLCDFTERSPFRRVAKDGTGVLCSVFLEKEAAEGLWMKTDFGFVADVYCHCKRVPSAVCKKKAEAGFTGAGL